MPFLEGLPLGDRRHQALIFLGYLPQHAGLYLTRACVERGLTQRADCLRGFSMSGEIQSMFAFSVGHNACGP